jgi:hypothetical protein
MRSTIIARFSGDVADEHKLPAYDAIQSLYGITRALLITTNYLVEGRVRHRRFEEIGFGFDLIAQRPGSFDTVFAIVTDPGTMKIAVELGIAITGSFICDFLKSIFQRSVGQDAAPAIEDLETEEKLRSGDLGALVEAIEPSMREAHMVVGRGAQNIVIIKGDNNIVSLDRHTKDYVNTSIDDERLGAKLFSIASFNANSGYGRAFDYEEGRTIPFVLSSDADRTTIDNILTSFSSYARRRRLGDDLFSAVALQYRATRSVDGRIKRIRVLRARAELRSL